MSFISYAPNFEDVMLWRSLKHVRKGFYIDVGAAMPVTHSTTKPFYDRGWRGINIEPDLRFYGMLLDQRPGDINLCLALHAQIDRKLMYFFDRTELSTLKKEIADTHTQDRLTYEARAVEVLTLQYIWQKYVPPGQAVHFLKVDTYGCETDVLTGNDWAIFRPWIVLVASAGATSHSPWENLLTSSGYHFVYADGINRFYLADEHFDLGEHFAYPPNRFDDFMTHSHKQAVDKALRSDANACAAENRALLNLAVVSTIENSLSWRVSEPLRRFKACIVMHPLWQNIRGWLLRREKIMNAAKLHLKRYPRVWQVVKKIVIFNAWSTHSDGDFLNVAIGHVKLMFSKYPLEDRRGIGRVSRELLEHLNRMNLEAQAAGSDDALQSRRVYFYASIHWCPDVLPQPSMVMIHDVIPLLFPDNFMAAAREWISRYAAIAKQASLVITVSHSSAKDIQRILGLPKERLHVIHNGVSRLPVAEKRPSCLPDCPYIVFVGSNDAHKNIKVVLSAMQDPSLHNVVLVMVGDNKSALPMVHQWGLADRVHFSGSLSDADTGYAISRAAALVFPSLYEGFGLPPLEAALLGTPSICSRRPAMTELLEGGVLFADPECPDEWASAIRRLVDSRSLGDDLVNVAQQRIRRYAWERAARQLADQALKLGRPE